MTRTSEMTVERLVAAADAVVRSRTAVYRKRYRLTEAQYRVLAHVIRDAPASLRELSKLMNRDCAQVSRSVRGLVDADLLTVARRQNSTSKEISATSKGCATFAGMADLTRAWEDAVQDRLSTEQLSLALQAIDCLSEAAAGTSEPETLDHRGTLDSSDGPKA